MNNLRHHKKIIVNACPIRLADEESNYHLLLNCKVAEEVWSHIIEWFDCSWAFPKSFLEAFEPWYVMLFSVRGRPMWRVTFLAALWTIWKERNSRSSWVKSLQLRRSLKT